MASDDLPLLHTLHCSLQKCFRALQEQHETWKNTLAACTSLLGSLSNLAEQMLASQKVAFANTPLQDFPCLPERLRYRQQCAAEALLEELEGKLLELQKVRDAAGVHVASVFQHCDQQEGLCQERAFQRSVLCPSLADMLEWLLDMEGFYHSIYLEVKLLLLQVTYEDLTKMQTLPQAWEQVLQHSLQNVVEDALLKVSFLEAG
ncbi:ribosome biogenesis protein C1orf109 homolog [Eublepharis macularius]|uniref:Ribosome biogenesis protein C1orf109 homolog n=1 Tax=Eublepharis macularius TaxID=481883 RepID=A0AA97LGC0_EUBMA|nr:ribosome biogenesis protein C1orf109 homolog [Eublepharis macularius]XP_054854646.1 ribosome biogenesis protein C1orf109 homolog [Eublepharis macularius]